jgi:predicted nucleic acid-binding Zn finger protein
VKSVSLYLFYLTYLLCWFNTVLINRTRFTTCVTSQIMVFFIVKCKKFKLIFQNTAFCSQSVFVFHMILSLNSNCLPKLHQQIHRYIEDVAFSFDVKIKVKVKVEVKLSLQQAVEAHRVVGRRGSRIFSRQSAHRWR